MFNWGSRSIDRMDGVSEYLVMCATNTLEESPVDLTIPWMGGVRSESDQSKLFIGGVSRCDGKINVSDHQSGSALDIRPVGWTNMSKQEIDENHRNIACLMLQNWSKLQVKSVIPVYLSLGWGGLYSSFYDPAHFYIIDIRELL